MNSDALNAFVVFSERLNFTHAAEALHLSQPALHVKIRGLAQELGAPLYRRVGRKLELTPQGRETARFGRESRVRTEEFKRRLRGVHPLDRAVTLAAGAGAYLNLLGAAIREFRKRNKNPLELLTANQEAAVDAVLTGRADLGVAALDHVPPELDARVLARVGQALVVPRRHRLAKKPQVRLTDLKGEKLIVPPAGRPHRIAISRALLSAGVPWEIAVEAAGWELMIHFVQLGLGAAIVNASCRIPQGLVARTLRELGTIPYHVFHLRGSPNEGPAARLEKLLLEYVTV